MLQVLRCHLAVMLLNVVLLLEVLSLQAKTLSSLEVLELEKNRRILYQIIGNSNTPWDVVVLARLQKCYKSCAVT